MGSGIMFESARLKLERADEHTRNLHATFATYAFENPYRALVHLDPQNGQRVWVDIEAVVPLPASLGLMLGDAIHNFRCALDHVAWELVGLDGGTQDKFTKFPMGDSRKSYESTARGMKTPRQDTKQFFIDAAAYPNGSGELLYALNCLDNADKHHVITPVAHASQVEGVTFINLATGDRERRGPLLTQPSFGDSATLIEAEPGWGIDATDNIDPTPDIFFGKVDIVPDEPVSGTLARFYMEVADTIRQATDFVRSRA